MILKMSQNATKSSNPLLKNDSKNEFKKWSTNRVIAKQQMCQDQKSRKGPTQKNRFTRKTGKDGNGDRKQ